MITLNGNQIIPTLFPDGTSQVWKLNHNIGATCHIDWTFSYEGELMHLAQLVDLLRVSGVNYISLNMDFLPYGRQDKNISNRTTFALRTFAKMINVLELNEITSLNTHNEVLTTCLINNFKNYFPWSSIVEAVDDSNPDVLCFPDDGASIRYDNELRFLHKTHVYGNKTRDQLTGDVTEYFLYGNVSNKDVLIVDDICDGGSTFIHLTKALLTAGAKSVSLYTTHGIYSKGLGPLLKSGIKKIYNKLGELSESTGPYGFFIKPFQKEENE